MARAGPEDFQDDIGRPSFPDLRMSQAYGLSSGQRIVLWKSQELWVATGRPPSRRPLDWRSHWPFLRGAARRRRRDFGLWENELRATRRRRRPEPEPRHPAR